MIFAEQNDKSAAYFMIFKYTQKVSVGDSRAYYTWSMICMIFIFIL